MPTGAVVLKVAAGGVTLVAGAGAALTVAADTRPPQAPLRPPAGHRHLVALSRPGPVLLVDLADPVWDEGEQSGYGSLTPAQTASLGAQVRVALLRVRASAHAADRAVVAAMEATLAGHDAEAGPEALPVAVEALAAAPLDARRRLVAGLLAGLGADARQQLTALLHLRAPVTAAAAPAVVPVHAVPTAAAPRASAAPPPVAPPSAPLVWSGTGTAIGPASSSYIS